MSIRSRIGRTVRQLTGASTNSPLKRELRKCTNGNRSMDGDLLNRGFAEFGDVVQCYCDHPPALQDEYLSGNWLHRHCECGAYLGVVEDQ